MTKQDAKKLLTIDKSMIGFITLVFLMGVSWATLQMAMKVNAAGISIVELGYKAEDARFQSSNQTRFVRIETSDAALVSDMTDQAILLERIITTMEFIQRDVKKLVDQTGG